MGCRIGMTSRRVRDRFLELVSEGKVPTDANYRTLFPEKLNYKKAHKAEKEARSACGSHCEGDDGGKPVKGKVYTIYRIDW